MSALTERSGGRSLRPTHTETGRSGPAATVPRRLGRRGPARREAPQADEAGRTPAGRRGSASPVALISALTHATPPTSSGVGGLGRVTGRQAVSARAAP